MAWLWLQYSAGNVAMLVSLVPTWFNMKVGGVIVVLAALLYFSSLHLCRISKLLWCTGCCRKLKLSTLFKTAQGAASSCPWRSKTKEKHRRERKKYTEREGGGKKERNDRLDSEEKRSRDAVYWIDTCARLQKKSWLTFKNAVGGSSTMFVT